MAIALRGILMALALCLCAPAAAQVDVEQYVKRDTFTDIKISLTGEYYAATVPLENRTVLAILRR